MTTADVKVARIKNGFPYFARVVLAIERAATEPQILFSCSGRGGFISQGYIEEVPAIGYDDWKGGARAGISFALAISHQTDCRVNVSTIEGLTTDTNPTIVGYAAALAVWRALEFNPGAEIIEKMESTVFASWRRPLEEIPAFP